MPVDGHDLLERLADLPRGRAVLDAAEALPGVYIVGGAVRDLAARPRAARDRRRRSRATPSRCSRALGGARRRARALRHRDGRRRGRRRARARRALRRARRAARRAPGAASTRTSRGATSPSTRSRSRLADGERARRRPAPARTSTRGGCACCTTPRSATTRRGCGASRATRRGWASRSRTRPRSSPPRRSPTARWRRSAACGWATSCASRCASPTRRPRSSASRRSTRRCCRRASPRARRARRGAGAAAAGRGAATCSSLAACVRGHGRAGAAGWLDHMGFNAAERDLVAAASRCVIGAPLRARARRRRSPAPRAARRSRRSRWPAATTRAAGSTSCATCALRDHGRRPAGRRRPAGPGGRRAAAPRAGARAGRRGRAERDAELAAALGIGLRRRWRTSTSCSGTARPGTTRSTTSRPPTRRPGSACGSATRWSRRSTGDADVLAVVHGDGPGRRRARSARKVSLPGRRSSSPSPSRSGCAIGDSELTRPRHGRRLRRRRAGS